VRNDNVRVRSQNNFWKPWCQMNRKLSHTNNKTKTRFEIIGSLYEESEYSTFLCSKFDEGCLVCVISQCHNRNMNHKIVFVKVECFFFCLYYWRFHFCFVFAFKQLVSSVRLESILNIFMRSNFISHKETFCLLYDWIVVLTSVWSHATR
jgi:hypothetical protein